MSEPRAEPTSDAERTPGATGKLLSALERALARQLALAGKGDFKAVLAEGDKTEEILEEVEKLPRPLPPSCVDRLEGIRELHRRLRLTLAQQKDETAGSIAQLRLGKRTLRAYGGGRPGR